MAVLRFRRRSDWLLALVDAVSAACIALAAYALRFEGQDVPQEFVRPYQVAGGTLPLLWIAATRSGGLYQRAVLRPGYDLVPSCFSASIGAGVVLLLVNALLLDGRLSRAWIGLVVLGLMVTGVGVRSGLRRARRALVPLGIALERYAVYGDDASAQRLRADLTRAPGCPFVVVDLFSRELGPAELRTRVRSTRIDGLILPAGADPLDMGPLASVLSEEGVDFLLAPSIGDLDLKVTSIAMFHGVPLLKVAGAAPRRRSQRQTPRGDLSSGVALMGTRGVPANYGGFETFAERLALHLVDRGVPVTVYCRRHYATAGASWRGISLVTLPTVRSKYFDTVVHTVLSVLHLVLRTRTRDVVLCNAANALVLPLLRLTGRRVLMNVDGLEWRRAKWGIAGRTWYRVGEWMAVRFASVLVTDANEVRTYYRVRHDTDSVMIPYGADLLDRGDSLPPEDLELARDGFFLYVSRWERENNPVLVALAHQAAAVDLPLVMLGAATYDEALDAEVRQAAGPQVRLPGAVYGDTYRRLQSNALAYVHATEVGGTHPALIEAMGAGNLCLVLDTPENREVAGAVCWLFQDERSLATRLREVAALPRHELERLRQQTRAYAASRYSWSAVGDAYLRELAPQRRPQSSAAGPPDGVR